jgi:uncharacterized protein YdbL (DUF1318 family)
MNKILCALLVFFCPQCEAAEKSQGITVDQAVQLATALRNFDGHLVVIKQNGAENTVMIPWEFGDGRLRLRVSNNLAILDAAIKSINAAQIAIFKEATQKASERTGKTEVDLPVGTPERIDYDRQNDELLKQPAPGTQDLSRIKASELKLDKNEIPVTVLTALKPILEDDVSK